MAKAALPKDFLWGFATASYQIEGAAHEDGRLDSIWDVFCRKPGKIADGSNGDVACDSYHRSGDDIALLQLCGAKAYRFSVAWTRIIPLGGRADPVNPSGLSYYVKLVEDLIAAGIEPVVTLFHWDLPDSLETRYGGLLNRDEFVADFTRYARVVFEALAPKVKYWVTFNEPWCSAILGYSLGQFAPGRTSDRTKNPEGDASTEPWIAGHNLLVAHGSAVQVFRDEFKERFGGQIGMTLNGDYAYPWDPEDPRDVEAAERKLEFSMAWFGDPIYFGKYPESMRQQLGARLPDFSAEEIALVQNSNDFFGMNHYTSNFVRHLDTPPDSTDFVGNVACSFESKDGEIIGPETQSPWLRPNPLGFRRLLNWISDRYGHPTIYVTENGTSVKGENELSVEQIVEDDFRASYFRDYIWALADAYSKDGVDVRGYMAWSLLDNFEWADGYETRFGVCYVDYEGGQRRIPKKSAKVVGKTFNTLIGESN
ncbi:glycoside hydrolase superfamily [Phyllosticta citribraziliensis]|uniref:Glycoside hydrolase superfamily n=1 Tax=Phyllosticta citribraziliensis TaxID=989973 RepID=A0ABR1M0F4_9PEZI